MDVASMVSGKIHCLVRCDYSILAESVIRTQVALNKAVHRHVSSPFMNGHDDVASLLTVALRLCVASVTELREDRSAKRRECEAPHAGWHLSCILFTRRYLL